MGLVLRFGAVIVLAAVALAASACAQLYWAGLLVPPDSPRPYTEMVSAAIVGALVAAAVSGYPLARLFPEKAWVAALFVALPVIALRAPDVAASGGSLAEAVRVMAWVEMLTYGVAVVLAAWFLSSRRRGSGNAL